MTKNVSHASVSSKVNIVYTRLREMDFQSNKKLVSTWCWKMFVGNSFLYTYVTSICISSDSRESESVFKQLPSLENLSFLLENILRLFAVSFRYRYQTTTFFLTFKINNGFTMKSKHLFEFQWFQTKENFNMGNQEKYLQYNRFF